ncbi:MAG TPA: helix-turn-helix domain-containing protein, partial [Candidatus Saccharimonadales bacterium]|nr:helix-turn-helix domain-containing protein [Candidatus Saccharimonadales bacterium]
MADTSLRLIDDLILTVFRLNGSLIEAGSRLVEDLGLTPAWWQVLGALALSPVSLTVPQIARNMGLARQSVQRVVALLLEKGFVRLDDNPHHRRAKL